ncbi:aminotransferase class V-fold PLP-dependent enzyme [Ramlibacter sp.]|uniref:pyridoxal phosphate-dependent decarboxylase family protein n=1 Tax=Ramlibacter sp. TaxID=1917967 RepID=UPI0018001AC9|nr:aminotransferase class V-fold PLP-dependent enzyme [Ramlibacter sp.]MBA2672777.1 aspartate aminotransferase family protein [Ramlibacter sp.]
MPSSNLFDQRPTTEAAMVTGLTAAVAQVLPPLEAFLRFEDGPDPAGKRSVWRGALNEPLPIEGQGAQAVLDALNEVVIPNGLRIGAPGFSGWITTMPSIVPAVAGFVASLVAAQRWYASPGNFLEMLALGWTSEMLGMGAGCGGTFTSGGAVANLVCLAAARQHAGERIGVNPTEEGAGCIPKPRVYATSSLHDVGVRALSVLGLGANAMRVVPMDAGRRRADCDALARMMDEDIAAGCTPVAVIATGGDVRTGTIDPVDRMMKIAHDRGVWLHVDGAYGGFGVLDDRVKHLYGDMGKIDSMAVDPHKWLAVPLGCGAAIVRDGALQQRSLVIGRPDFHHFDPSSRADVGSPFDEFGEGSLYSSVDFSARSRGLTVWAALKEIGVDGMRARVARHLDCARRIAELARGHERLEVVSEPELSICTFRYIPPGAAREPSPALDQLNEAVLKGVRARGRCVPSSAVVDGKFVIRPAFVGPNTEIADAEALVHEVLAVGAELAAR